MFDLVALRSAVVFLYDKQRVEEIGVVFFVIDGAMVRLVIAPAEGCEPIAMVGVPVAEMLDLRMQLFDLPEDLFLIIAVLKKAYGGALRLGTRPDHAMQMDLVPIAYLAVGADQAPA